MSPSVETALVPLFLGIVFWPLPGMMNALCTLLFSVSHLHGLRSMAHWHFLSLTLQLSDIWVSFWCSVRLSLLITCFGPVKGPISMDRVRFFLLFFLSLSFVQDLFAGDVQLRNCLVPFLYGNQYGLVVAKQ
ncbi:hypothetical protein MPH_05429 [Macrophomina phaseolina MS6]|uniref:Uncharacterized protein n=1 Tax=Macrophomina phaseolina (strain MS6) TaxID=1126212 RepID=K2RRM2_MACPH|nr:hypothetical protein MPH_05429 [Macrophomina phaseolina MS6]